MTYEDAVTEMYDVFRLAWNSGAAAIAGAVPEVFYEGEPKEEQQPTGVIWANVYHRNASEDQATLGTPEGPGTHDYESVGLLVVRIRAPKGDGMSTARLRALSTLVANAYRKAGGQVWYREVTRRNRDPDERWYTVDVTATYEFRETV